MLQAFNRPVIIIDMGNFKLRAYHGFLKHGIAMILRSNVAAVRFQIFDRVITAAMTELQLRSISAASQGEQLMTQADAEDRIFAEQAP